MRRIDVLIAGCGPAGAATALRLARNGYDVAVVEHRAFPRIKVCGEYLNAGALDELDALGCAERARAGRAVEAVRLHAGGRTLELPLPRPGRSVPRAELDAELQRAAVAAGAQLVAGRLIALRVSGGGTVAAVRTSAGETLDIAARMTVGADGSGSAAARFARLSRPSARRRRFAVGGHYGGFPALDPVVEMYVEPDRYLAINPLDAHTANVMCVVSESRLAQSLAATPREVGAARLQGGRVAFGPLDHRVRAVARGGIALVGDAAGFLDPFTGQGVYLALRGARLLADAVAASDLRAYAREVGSEMRARRILGRIVHAAVVVPPASRRAARVLERLPSRADALLRAVAGIGSARAALTPTALAGMFW